ncbi:DUF484 family protein [Paludibacterium paludis]|uniref:DUF484 family protein n=1 Tax=Paludibacterium paludis TaxID=1225769 RepID=A0A918P5T9_9NEIS|nr:DUF484 family protein [Paludibacterium paludis]GGY22499.1 hypothetical protein GCM10011289_27890 [Paludibacterium paludis]
MHSDDVLAFLDSHPDFLTHHAERFGLRAAPQERVVVSFAERQLLDMKDRIRQLESRLHQLVRHGEANDLIQARSHRLALGLMQARSTESVLAAVSKGLLDIFQIDRVALRLWHPQAETRTPSCTTTRADIQLLARNLSAPSCGPYANDEVLSWFPPVPVLQSFAQIALREESGEPFGLLVLASDNADRFTFDMHTHYLAQMGEMVSAALLRTLGAE